MELIRIVIDESGEREEKVSTDKTYPPNVFVAASVLCSRCYCTYYAACKNDDISTVVEDERCPVCNKSSSSLEDTSLSDEDYKVLQVEYLMRTIKEFSGHLAPISEILAETLQRVGSDVLADYIDLKLDLDSSAKERLLSLVEEFDEDHLEILALFQK